MSYAECCRCATLQPTDFRGLVRVHRDGHRRCPGSMMFPAGVEEVEHE